MKCWAGLAICALCACALLAQESPEPLVFQKAIRLENVGGRIDHLAVDVAGQRLFVAALGNGTVEVVDLQAGKRIQSLAGFAEPQGIVYVPEFDRVFVANGSDGTCCVLDGHTFNTIKSVKLGDDADNVRYDEKRKRIYVGYGSGALGVIGAKIGAKLADIPLPGHPESFRLSSTGPDLFVNVPGAHQIAVVDREKAKVTATWWLKETRSNFPMSLDEANHRMFVGCRSPAAVLVYDYTAGRQVAIIPISPDTDDLFYNADKKLIYVSCGGGGIEVIKQADADHYSKVRTIPSPSGARTSLFIAELRLFCLAVPHHGNQSAEIRVFKAN